MDTEVRQCLTKEEQQALGSLAKHVVSYLAINREAIEGRRAKRMSDGLNHFIEGKGSLTETDDSSTGRHESYVKRSARQKSSTSRNGASETSESSSDDQEHYGKAGAEGRQNQNNMESVSYEKIFARAANLLRETFELDEGGGVIFAGASKGLKYEQSSDVTLQPALDAQIANGDESDMEDVPPESSAHQVSTVTTFDPILNAFSKDPEHPAPLLALSTHDTPFAPNELLRSTRLVPCGQVDKEVLRELFRRYPKGRLWIFDEAGFMSASDEEHRFERRYGRKESTKSVNSSTWKRGEPTLLRRAFPGVRQLMFAPCWDAETSDFTSACFVWSRDETRVLSSATDLSFLNSFGKAVMAELSRLDTVLADKQKGDFIGTKDQSWVLNLC